MCVPKVFKQNPFIAKRKEDKILLLSFLKREYNKPDKAGKDRTVEQLLADYSFNTGFSLEVLKTYLHELVLAGYIILSPSKNIIQKVA